METKKINKCKHNVTNGTTSIKFVIKQDGTVTEEVIGAVGNECESLTKNIEEKLGVVQRVERKPEYYSKNKLLRIMSHFTCIKTKLKSDRS